MKKYSFIRTMLPLLAAFLMVICTLVGVVACAEAPAQTAETATVWDWTPVATSVINLANLLVIWVVTTLVRPWLEKHKLYDAACIAVNAAEATIGRYHGKEKLEAAINYMAAEGFNVDTDKVMDAINTAWTNLNNSQVAIGTKADKPPEVEVPYTNQE